MKEVEILRVGMFGRNTITEAHLDAIVRNFVSDTVPVRLGIEDDLGEPPSDGPKVQSLRREGDRLLATFDLPADCGDRLARFSCEVYISPQSLRQVVVLPGAGECEPAADTPVIVGSLV